MITKDQAFLSAGPFFFFNERCLTLTQEITEKPVAGGWSFMFLYMSRLSPAKVSHLPSPLKEGPASKFSEGT